MRKKDNPPILNYLEITMADIATPKWRDKNKIGNLMNRLQRHANGEIEMTTSQIRAAEVYLKKTLPDLASTQHTGDKENPISFTFGWEK